MRQKLSVYKRYTNCSLQRDTNEDKHKSVETKKKHARFLPTTDVSNKTQSNNRDRNKTTGGTNPPQTHPTETKNREDGKTRRT